MRTEVEDLKPADEVEVDLLKNPKNGIDNDQTIETGIQAALKERLFLGIDPSPEVIAIMSIYFVEGALGLARLAQTFFLKDELHLGPADLSALTGLFTLPWTIKVCFLPICFFESL